MGTSGNWAERHHTTFQGFTHCATNLHCSSTTRRLFGGTACFMTSETAHKSMEHGRDPTNLGRWTWTLIRGRLGIRTRILSGYRPTRSYNDEALTVYSQQELYFRTHGGWRDPRTAFFEDLDSEVQKWLLAGEQLIIGMDVNEDTRSPEIRMWRDRWNLSEPLTILHGETNVATCRSNSTQTPIDTVWSTPGLDITNGGMTGFGELDMGSADHRLLWVDIDMDSMFGFRPPAPIRRPPDSLPLHDPRVITKYNNFVRRERDRIQLGPKILALEHKAYIGTFNSDDKLSYDHLLSLDFIIRKTAKVKCRPFYSGQVLYSDTIGCDRKEIHMWDMVIARRHGKRSDTRAIRRLMISTRQPTALQKSLDEAEQEKVACQARYLANKKQHIALHDAFRQRICERRALKFNTSIAVQEKIVKNNRRQSNAFQKIKRVLGHKIRPTLSTVEYNDPLVPAPIICDTKETIEQACSAEGYRRFTQSSDTPFLQGSLLRDLGYNATQSTVDLILTGNYPVDMDVDPHTVDLIRQLRMPDSIGAEPPITGHVTTADHISGWKKMRSSIASSPFGPLFSDHIAGCEDVRVADIDAAMAAIPALTGFSPLAWQKAVDVMIPKKSTSVHVQKLRIIVLFHSLYNMINKTIGRLAVRRAEAHRLIPAEAYGSRPGRRANICALNKVLTYDVLRQRRLPAALCSNDAISCYDRIVHTVASICLQRVGVSAETCHMMFGTLQHIEHFVATAYGISDTGYGAVEFPLQGIGQGNGAGPAIWLLMTIPLINMLRDKGLGFRSTTPLSKKPYRFVCYTFVDDTDTIHSTEDPSVPVSQIVAEMQQSLNTWEGGLRATGGALSLEKSYWYLLSMHWNHARQRWDYQPSEKAPGNLRILGNSPTQYSLLTRYEPDHAEETLGLWIAPDSNQKAQVLALTQKISKWSDKIRTKQLTSSLAWLSISSGISMTLKYPLTATNLTKKECQLIMKPLLDCALPALGLPRSMPHAVVFAPKEYLGYGLFDLWLHQSVDQIQACLDYGHRTDNDITGNLLRDVTESLRLELGLPHHPLTYDYVKFHRCTTPTKLHVLWQFCSSNGLSLRDGCPPSLPLREGDRFLMEIFADSGCSPIELAILNRCRMTLQIEQLSDITTGDGMSLHPFTLESRTPPHHRTNTIWPKTGTPNAHSWRIWRDTIIRCCLPPRSNSLRLTSPLGKWMGQPAGWKWFYSPLTNKVYCHDEHSGSYRVYERHGAAAHHTRRAVYRRNPPPYDILVANLPLDALPTTTTGTIDKVSHTGHQPVLMRPTTDPSWRTSLVIHSPDDFSQLRQGIQTHTAIAVTDGSFKDGMGTAGFTILPSIDSPNSESFTLANHTPGAPEDVDAYRAELGGIYGIIRTTLDHLIDVGIPGSMTIACDCASAITNITRTHDPPPNCPHYDLLSHIRFLIKTSNIKWNFCHVRGHQDDRCSYSTLDRWAQLNVDMDGLAKSYWQTLDDHTPNRPPAVHLPPFPGQWSIWHGNYRFPSWTLLRAQTVYYRPSTELFWNKRLQRPDAMTAFDWPSAATALQRLPTYQRLWVPKWLCSVLPIGKNLQRWGASDSTGVCPRCGEDENHKHHIISCMHPGASGLRQNRLNKLAAHLDTVTTEPDLKVGFLSMIQAAISQQPWNPPSTTSDLLQATYVSQTALGTAFVLDGFLSPLWSSTQQAHYQGLGRRTTGRQWCSKVIRLIWQIAWDLWIHRRRIKDSVDDCALPALHLALDTAIEQAYTDYYTSPDITLARWFSRNTQELHAESLDWKTRWLEMIKSTTHTLD